MARSENLSKDSSRHNAVTLSFAQAINGATGPVAISLGALAGAYLSPSAPELATLPVAGYGIGVALFAVPVALLCNKLGRRFSFITGGVIAIIGALIASLALAEFSFALFCFGLLLIGGAGAFVQQYRFAAADQGDDKFKSRAISWVMTGGIAAAFIGPQLVLFSKDMLLPTPFAGAFVAMAMLSVLGILILGLIRPVHKKTDDIPIHDGDGRPIKEIISQPKFIVALVCAISSYTLMTFVMTGAPLAMTHHGHSEDLAVLGIQWHVLAMYGPSFFTGLLIVKFGKPTIIAAGLLLLIICAITALAGVHLWNFWGSLILLGLGWNFGFIGSTALIGETYAPSEKNKVQGLHDLILFSCVAAASLLSGLALHKLGWNGVASFLIPIACLGLLSLTWLSFFERKMKISEGL